VGSSVENPRVATAPNCLHGLSLPIRHIFRVEAALDRIRCHRHWRDHTDSFSLP
jgi:hypothetical protein